MNILYFCNVQRLVPTELGVLKKVQAQCDVLRSCGYNVYLACLEDSTKYVILDRSYSQVYEFYIADKNRLTRDKFILSEIENFVIANDIKVVYSRYSNFSISAHCFYLRLRKHGVKCLLEIPTYPLSQRWTAVKQNLKKGHFFTAMVQTFNSSIGTLGIFFFKRSLDRIVNNNGFTQIWGIPVIPITNGIDVSSIPRREHLYIENKKDIIVVSVANIARWHGFDRFIAGLHEYYKRERDINVFFELAGPGMEVEILKELALKLEVDQYVKFLGPISGKALDDLYERADIGISILGIHRNNMSTIDCLKSREFCARQLPFITQSAEKHFNNTKFSLQVPSDESPVNVQEIVEFYKRVCIDKSILDDMYTFAREKCDWNVAFRNVVNYINKIDDEKDFNA